MQLQIPGPAGRLEALLAEPSHRAPHALVVFAHPLPSGGGTMHTKVVYQAAKGVARIGCAVLRFNFRGVGTSSGRVDEGRGAMDDYRAALDFLVARHPDVREVWAAGFSFGSWVAWMAGAEDDRVTTLIGVAPPITKYDFSAVLRSAKPTFLVAGERDEICPLKDVRAFYVRLAEPKELVVIDAADHLFDGKAAEVGDALADLLEDWGTS